MEQENIVTTNYLHSYESQFIEVSFIRYPLGQILATPKALKGVDLKEIQEALARHAHGDWGDVSQSRAAENWQGLWSGGQVLSSYASRYGTPFLISTRSDRSSTLVLLTSEL